MNNIPYTHAIVQQYQFEELKEHLDKNRTYEGASKLGEILNNALIALVDDINSAMAQQDFWLQQQVQSGSELQSGTISLDPAILEELKTLREEVNYLKSLHVEGANHIPEIISTREQLETAKEKFDKEDRVIIETQYDRAMSIL